MEKAFFVRYPRTYENLTPLHMVGREQPFQIAYAVELSDIEYENFIFGMDADRQFIEDHARLCSDKGVKKCLLVKQRKSETGILVVPVTENPSYVQWAAFYQPK